MRINDKNKIPKINSINYGGKRIGFGLLFTGVIPVRRIQVLCSGDCIPGATKIGSYWAIPADAEKPDDRRIKSGKYVKGSK